MALALLLCALAWFLDPAALDALRWKTSLLLAVAPLAFIASAFAGRLKLAAADALPRAFLALALLVVWAIFGAVVQVDPATLASRPIAVLVLLLIVAVLGWFDGFDKPFRLPLAALAAGVPVAVLCIAQVLGVDPFFSGEDAAREAVATFGNTNAAGEFLAPLVPLAVGIALGAGGNAAWLARGALPLLVCAVILTSSRGAALAAAAPSVLVVWFAARRFAPAATARVVPAIAALALGALLPLAIGARDAYSFKSAEDDAAAVTSPEYRPNKQRLLLATAAWSMAKHAPLMGFGPGRFEAAFPPFRDPEEAKLPTKFGTQVLGSEAEDPHNLYLLLLCEGGVPALALFLMFVLSALGCVRSARVLPDGDPRIPVVYGAFGALLAVLVVGVFRGALPNPALMVLAFAVAGQLFAYYDGPSASPNGLGVKGTVVIVALLAGVFVLGVRGLGSDLYVRSAELGVPVFDRVDRAYGSALAWDPTHTDVMEHRGDMLTRLGSTQKQLDVARATWNELLAQRPYSLAAHLGLADLDARAGHADSAWSHLRMLHRLREGSLPKQPAALLAVLADGGRHAAHAALLADAYAHGNASDVEVEAAAKALEAGTPAQRAAAASLLGILAAKDPWNGDLAYRRAQALKDQDDAQAAVAFHRAHLAYALDQLQGAKLTDARRNLKLAARYGDGPEDVVVEGLCKAAEAKSADMGADAPARWKDCAPDFRQRVMLLDANPDLGPAIAALSKSH